VAAEQTGEELVTGKLVVGESKGWVSDCPLICLISTRRSLRSRSAAQAASMGLPKLSTSMGYIQPSLKLALCEMASSSLPALR
jgi:hypothetical protein